MKSPLTRIQRGGIALTLIVLTAVLVFHYYASFPWWEAIWFVVITLSSVGYGERSTLPPELQLFTAAVIIFGMLAVAYTFGGFVQVLLEGEIVRLLGHQRMTREINQLKNHTIVCGYGRIGQTIAADLERHGEEFVIVEQDPLQVQEAAEKGRLCMLGDATDDESLLTAGVHRAKALITALPDDASSVFITLTARNLNRDLLIISRAELPATERKLRQAGADRVVLPSSIGAQQMSRLVTRPSTADLMELMADTGNLHVELDEFRLNELQSLVGRTVRDSEARSRFGLLLLAIKQVGGGMVFNPPADYRFQTGDVVVIMGPTENIERFRTEYRD